MRVCLPIKVNVTDAGSVFASIIFEIGLIRPIEQHPNTTQGQSGTVYTNWREAGDKRILFLFQSNHHPNLF